MIHEFPGDDCSIEYRGISVVWAEKYRMCVGSQLFNEPWQDHQNVVLLLLCFVPNGQDKVTMTTFKYVCFSFYLYMCVGGKMERFKIELLSFTNSRLEMCGGKT